MSTKAKAVLKFIAETVIQGIVVGLVLVFGRAMGWF